MNKNFLILALFAVLFSSCTRPQEEVSSVKVKLPQKLMSSPNKKVLQSAMGSTQWGLEAPAALNSFDCYAVYASASDLPNGSCKDLAGLEITKLSHLYGFFKAGAEISIDVKAGSDRKLGVFGLKSADGNCDKALDGSLKTSNYSAPLLIGQINKSLSVGSNTAEIKVSLDGSKTIESCQGEAIGAWPRCNPNLIQANYLGDGQINLIGSCLDKTESVKIENVTDGVTTQLSLISKTSSNLLTKLSTNLSFSKGKIYKVLISNANAQTASVGLVISNEYSVLANGGNLIGSWLNGHVSGGKPGSGYMPLYMQDLNGDIIGYAIHNGVQYFLSGYLLFDIAYQDMSFYDIKQLTGANVSNSIYFSGANCTGDILVNGTQHAILKLRYIVAPHGCSGTYPSRVCSSKDYLKWSGTPAPVFETNLSYESYTNVDAYNSGGDLVACQDASSTLTEGYRLSANSFSTISLGTANTPPASLNNIKFGKK